MWLIAGLMVFLSACTGELTAQKKNVVLIISDDLNTRIGPYMELDGHTPHLDQLAAEGLSFTRAYCQYPLCGPSRASLMSGLYPETNGVLGNQQMQGSYRAKTPSLSDHPSMAGFFREQGYYTARVSKIFHMGVPGGIERGDPGDDDPDSWDYSYNVLGPETQSPGKLELLSPANRHYGSSFTRMAIEEKDAVFQADHLAVSQAIAVLESRAGTLAPEARNLKKHKPGEPFFLAVGLVRPHVPFIYPESCLEPYPEHEISLPDTDAGFVPEPALAMLNDRGWKMNDTQKKQVISGYMASVRFMDQQVGRVLEALDRLDLREETIIVFISDHGYNLGEHDCWAKQSLWEGTLRIPMIISYPGMENKGEECAAIAELIDLYPTLADLNGFAETMPGILQGNSLASYVHGNVPDKPKQLAYTISHKGKAGSIRTDGWRYTRWPGTPMGLNEELYDHSTDPEERNNLSLEPEFQTRLELMRELFVKARQKATRSRPSMSH